MHKIIIKFGFLTGLLFSLSSLNTQCFLDQVPAVLSSNKIINVAAAAAGIFVGYKLVMFSYDQGKKYLESKIINETVDAITLALTRNSTIDTWPAVQKENALRKKAQLINMRKRVLAVLTDKVSDNSRELSQEHRNLLAYEVKRANNFFSIVDVVRKENPYEKEYEVASLVDQTIESYIISSIILELKPNAECTQKELNEKQTKMERKAKILAKLEHKVSKTIFAQLMKVSLFCTLVSASLGKGA